MYLLIEISIKTEGNQLEVEQQKMTFLCSTENDILSHLGSSLGFSGRFPGHFAALRAKAMTRRALSCICSRVIRGHCWASFPVNFSGQIYKF